MYTETFFCHPQLEWSQKKTNCVVATISGTLFFVGWWFMIDVGAVYPHIVNFNKVYYVPGVCATVSFVVVNSIPLSAMKGSYYYDWTRCARVTIILVMFVGLVATFGTLIASAYILINDFLLGPPTIDLWPGWAMFLQNFLIASSSLLIKFGTKREEI